MKPQLNRADLLHCLAVHGPEALDNLALKAGRGLNPAPDVSARRRPA